MKFLFTIFVALIAATANGVDAYKKSNVRYCGRRWIVHEIQSGDTCYDLAAKSAVDSKNFLSKNLGKISDCKNLKVGQKVCVKKPRCQNPHRILSGETCHDLAKMKGISVVQLKDYNPGLNCDNLKVGWPVCCTL